MEGGRKTLTRQPAQPCVCCGEATDATGYIGDRKVPMCPACSIRFEAATQCRDAPCRGEPPVGASPRRR